MSSVREINIKSRTNYFSHDLVNKKDLETNKIKTDEKAFKKLLLLHFYYIGYVT